VLAAVLILLTAAIRPLANWIERIPASIAAAMLAGHPAASRGGDGRTRARRAAAGACLLIALFLVARGLVPTLASLIVLAAGALPRLVAGGWSNRSRRSALLHLELVSPAWDAATLIGLGVPLYLVTMASQNLPGFAVLRARATSRRPSRCWPLPARCRWDGIPGRAHFQSRGDLGGTLHRSGGASRSGSALEGRDLLCAVVGADRSIRRVAGRVVRRAAASAAGHRRGHGASGLDGQCHGSALAADQDRSPLPARWPLPLGHHPDGRRLGLLGLCFGLLVLAAERVLRPLTQMCVAAGRAWAGSFKQRETFMKHFVVAAVAAFVFVTAWCRAGADAGDAAAQAPVREITKIAGEVYRFRNNGHYSVFAVTPAGIIAPTRSTRRRRPGSRTR